MSWLNLYAVKHGYASEDWRTCLFTRLPDPLAERNASGALYFFQLMISEGEQPLKTHLMTVVKSVV